MHHGVRAIRSNFVTGLDLTDLPHPAEPGQRDLRLDFFRGLSLLMIFIDHIPGNFLSHLTLHSIAFSDAAEVFVFISGYAAALAYGRLFTSKGFRIAVVHIYHRHLAALCCSYLHIRRFRCRGLILGIGAPQLELCEHVSIFRFRE